MDELREQYNELKNQEQKIVLRNIILSSITGILFIAAAILGHDTGWIYLCLAGTTGLLAIRQHLSIQDIRFEQYALTQDMRNADLFKPQDVSEDH